FDLLRPELERDRYVAVGCVPVLDANEGLDEVLAVALSPRPLASHYPERPGDVSPHFPRHRPRPRPLSRPASYRQTACRAAAPCCRCGAPRSVHATFPAWRPSGEQ